jgi:hypothetical protein
MAESSDAEDQGSSSQSAGAQILGFVAVVLLLIFVGFVLVEIFPHNVRNAQNPSFVDNIFANPAVLLAVRIALLAGAVYVVVSVIALMGGRRWLSELGPFKAPEPIARLNKSAELLQDELQDAVKTIQALEQSLVESDESLASAQADIDLLLKHIDTIEAKKEGN